MAADALGANKCSKQKRPLGKSRIIIFVQFQFPQHTGGRVDLATWILTTLFPLCFPALPTLCCSPPAQCSSLSTCTLQGKSTLSKWHLSQDLHAFKGT